MLVINYAVNKHAEVLQELSFTAASVTTSAILMAHLKNVRAL